MGQLEEKARKMAVLERSSSMTGFLRVKELRRVGKSRYARKGNKTDSSLEPPERSATHQLDFSLLRSVLVFESTE